MSKVLIVGMGDIGKQVLNFLVRDPKCPEILVGEYKEDFGKKRVNAAISNAAVMGMYPKVSFKKWIYQISMRRRRSSRSSSRTS